MTKPATASMRAFAIRKARRYWKRDGKWLTDEAIDDILETIEEFTGLRYSGQSLINWVTAWRCSGIVRPKQQRSWANYKDKGWRKTPFAAEKRIERSLTANNGQRARHVRDMVWQNDDSRLLWVGRSNRLNLGWRAGIRA